MRRLYGRGFKILLDLIAAARGEVQRRRAALPACAAASTARASSALRVIAEFFMLLLYHLTGRLLPARFFLFAAVGVTGVGVHLAVLWAAFNATGGQLPGEPGARHLGGDDQQLLPEQRLHLRRPAPARPPVWRGLLSFYVACGVGALINLAIADWLFLQVRAVLAGRAGRRGVAAVWNFFTTASFTWGADGSRKR